MSIKKIIAVQPATPDYFIEKTKKSGLWYEKKLADISIPADILSMLDREIIEIHQIMPVEIEQDRLILVTDQIQSLKKLSYFEDISKWPVKIKITDPENIKNGIFHHYNLKATLSNPEMNNNDDDLIPSNIEKSLIEKTIEKIFTAALNEGASDIHLLPGENTTYVLLKIDGRLVNFSSRFPISKNEKIYLVNVIKLMCTPPREPSNSSLPDRGSIKYKWNEKWIDLRVSTMPTIRGQKVVIRLLNSSRVPLDLDQLGFTPEDKRFISKILMLSSGLFIVSSPVGTGKSTTIHAALKAVRGLEHNIITIENPAEHKDEFLTQIEMRLDGEERMQLTGERIFDSVLQQDPETIFYTETRSPNDAALLLRACLSGHQIFTTLHARNAISSLYRLFNMGVDKEDLLRELNGILSQRLLAANCPHCSESYVPTEEETLLLRDEEIEHVMSGTPKKGAGCSNCHNGYKGRIVVCESILFDNELRDFILFEAKGIVSLKNFLKKKGFRSIWDKGLDLVKEGKVTLSELIRVFPPDL